MSHIITILFILLLGHVDKYLAQLSISKKLKESFLWITSMHVNHETMVTQIPAALPPSSFYSEKSYVYFLAICAKFAVKIGIGKSQLID